MSLYNMIAGMNANLVVMLSPFLPRRADQFPRFRDVFTGADDSAVKGDIYVYTRMGGGNRECWGGTDGVSPCDCPACDAGRIEEEPACIYRYDDDFDCTYSTFVFNVGDDDRADFDALMVGKPHILSDRYKARLRALFSDGGEKTLAFVEALCTAPEPPAGGETA